MIYTSRHISALYRGFINDYMYVDIKCSGAAHCAEVNAICLILMLIEDIQCRKKKLSDIGKGAQEANKNTSSHTSFIRRMEIIENAIERNKDMVISILIKCTEGHFYNIRTSLKKFSDRSSWLEEYKDLEMVAVFGKTESIIALEEQYLES